MNWRRKRPFIPDATYRFQFSRRFTLAQARGLLSYLSELGVTDCYSSPLLKARRGSTHGYDVVDYGSLNDEIGTRADLASFVGELRRLGMGLILDTVPNHMSAGDEN